MTDRSELDVFSNGLDARGADLARWPKTDAEAARLLLARSAAARARHAAARRLDALVAEAATAGTPNGFAFRVVAEIAARRQDRFAWVLGSPGRVGLAGFSFCAAALAIGVALGASVAPHGAPTTGLDLGAADDVSLSDGDL